MNLNLSSETYRLETYKNKVFIFDEALNLHSIDLIEGGKISLNSMPSVFDSYLNCFKIRNDHLLCASNIGTINIFPLLNSGGNVSIKCILNSKCSDI